MLHVLFSVYLKMLVLYSPFFVLSCFISLTRGYSNKERRRLAWKVALATLISSVLLYLFGRTIFVRRTPSRAFSSRRFGRFHRHGHRPHLSSTKPRSGHSTQPARLHRLGISPGDAGRRQ